MTGVAPRMLMRRRQDERRWASLEESGTVRSRLHRARELPARKFEAEKEKAKRDCGYELRFPAQA
jgi:hypothetical protein